MQRRWQVLTLVSVATFVASLDLFIVNIAFPDIRADLGGASVGALSWVLNAYAIVFAALLVPAGRLADRTGRKRGFLAGLALFSLGSALCGVAPSVAALVAARVLQAAGAALLVPTSLALLLPEFAPRDRPAAIGIWAGVGAAAAAAGPPLGGLLVQADWRLVFLVNLPVGAWALWRGSRLLTETRDASEQGRPDWLGTALLAASVGALALGFVQAPVWGWADPRTLVALAGAVAGLALFALRCTRHPSPVVDPAMVRVRSFAMANVAAILFSAAFGAMLLSNVLFMTGVWQDSILRAGLQLAPGPALAAITAVASSRLTNRVGQRVLAAVGCTLFATGITVVALRAGTTPDYAGDLLPGLLLTGPGVGFVLPALSSAAAASLPPARFATGAAVLTMSRQLGIALGVAILVAVLGTPAPGEALAAFQDGWTFQIIAALLGAAAGLAIGRVSPALSPAPVVPRGTAAGTQPG
jgi:EmrB/QacA subfamily drug resistance transporter